MRLKIYNHLYHKRADSKTIFQCKQIKCDYFTELEPDLDVFQIWHEFGSYFVKMVKLNEFKDFLPMNLAYRSEVHKQVLLLSTNYVSGKCYSFHFILKELKCYYCVKKSLQLFLKSSYLPCSIPMTYFYCFTLDIQRV